MVKPPYNYPWRSAIPFAAALAGALIVASCAGPGDSSGRAERRAAASRSGAAQPSAEPEAPRIPPPSPVTPPAGEGWMSLFNGRNLEGWKVTDFGGHGEVRVENGHLILEMGAALTGVTRTNPVPKINYEVVWDGMRIDGSDFFCALTMPVAESHCTFVLGGWGGGVVGISSIDGQDAAENETTSFRGFEKGRWYKFRARVTENRIQCWIDEDKLIDVDITERRINLRAGDIDLSAPFGFASWQTSGAIRGIFLRSIPPGG